MRPSIMQNMIALAAMAVVEEGLNTKKRPNTEEYERLIVEKGPAVSKTFEPIPQAVIDARIKRLERNKAKLAKGAW